MDDEYEAFFGLNMTTNDAALDPDGDGLDNLAESQRWTDPFVADTDRDGFRDGFDSNAVSRAWIGWGDSWFVRSNAMVYTWPAWMVSAFKNGGEWQTNPPAWHVSATETGAASLGIELDRALLTNDLRMKMGLAGSDTAALYLDLRDTNGFIVASNVLDNLLSNTGTGAVKVFSGPLGSHPHTAGLSSALHPAWNSIPPDWSG